jgi:hypothetical protein
MIRPPDTLQVRRRSGLAGLRIPVLSPENNLPGVPKPFQLVKSAGLGGHQVNYHGSHVNKAPFVLRRGPSLPVGDFNLFFQGKVRNLPVEALQMGVAGNGGNDKKIGPTVQFPEIQNNYLSPAVILKQPAQRRRQFFTGPAALSRL